MAERFPIPTSEQLGRSLVDIEHWCDKVRDLWRWAEPDAYRRPKRGSNELVSGGAAPDLADDVISTERYRVLLRHAAREVLDAGNRIRGAVADLNDALALLEPLPSAQVSNATLLPRPADRGDLVRAREAQRHRESRARGSGDYGEVTG